uniref:Calreticulin n=1 Tax=Stomoxys calcitrans TaxID=35570 RepID=A0A1I8PZT1_STOCA
MFISLFQATIPDPEDTKPADWDKPEHIPDPDATKPEDWDDEMDGEWEPPMIDNPEFKGEWQPRQLDNPNYKGPWEHPEINNPEYTPEPNLYLRKEICIVGLDLWQVKSGSIFDNILVTDDIEMAIQISADVKKTQEGERKMKESQDEEQRKKEENEQKSSYSEDEDDNDNEDKEDIPEQDDLNSDHDEL